MTEPVRHAPDLEELAAYVDGRLSAERRAWVEEHLVRDPELYEVFQATVEFQREHGRVAETPRLGRAWLLVPLAAAAVLVLTLAPALLRERVPSERWADRLDTAAIATLGSGWSDSGWSRNRSLESCPAVENLPFRMGAWSLDLRVALRANDDREARQLAAQLKFLASCGDLFLAERAYEHLEDRWDDIRPVDRRELAATSEKELAEVLAAEPHEIQAFQLGAWAEAGRLAALTGNAAALRMIIENDPGAAEIPDIAPQLAELEALAELTQLEARDFAAATEAFTVLCRILAG